jgi:methionyl-tRNA formyltransferase
LPRAEPGKILPAKGCILVACGEGILEIMRLQMPGGKPLAADDFLRGRRLEGAFFS